MKRSSGKILALLLAAPALFHLACTRSGYDNGGRSATAAGNRLDSSDSNNATLGTDAGAEQDAKWHGNADLTGGRNPNRPASQALDTRVDVPQNPSIRASSATPAAPAR